MFKFCDAILLLLSATPCILSYQSWRTIYHKISQDAELSEFYVSMVKLNRIAKLNLHYYDLTVFAPDNSAIDNYSGEIFDNLVFYHMSFDVKTLKLLNKTQSIITAGEANPPLWVSIDGADIYINNAKIIAQRSDYFANTKNDRTGKNQVLHIIDEVLDPMIHSTAISQNPTAFDFLSNYHRWKIGPETLSHFFEKVKLHNQAGLFEKPGSHTFFIPVDSKIDDFKLQKIDKYIIDAHVVPNQILFTRPSKKNFIFETAANGDYIYIVISLVDQNSKLCVKSYTVLGNSNHAKGEIVSEIIQANIPVANGVVHLISRPLGVFDRILKPFPYLSVFYKISSDPQLAAMYNFGERTGINKLLTNATVIYTYFAPTDRALAQFADLDDFALKEVVGRHVVMSTGRFSMQKLILMSKSSDNGVVLNTLSGPMSFNVSQNGEGFYEIEWKNKTIAVKRADYECSDGIVHVLDGVFGEIQEVGKQDGVKVEEGRHGFWKNLKQIVT